MRSCSPPGSRSRRRCEPNARERRSRASPTSSPTRPTRSRWRASARSTSRVETKPDLTPVSRGRPRGRGGDPRARARAPAGRGRVRRGVRRRRRPRRAGSSTRSTARGTTCAASRSGATLLALERDGGVDVGRRVGAGARPPLVGGARRGRRGPARRAAAACRRSARVEDCVVSTTAAARDAARLARTSRAGRGRSRGFSDFWQHCLVAEGSVDVATDPVLALWDYAAVQLIVEEAGGRCTTFAGDPPAPGASLLSANAAPPRTRRSRRLPSADRSASRRRAACS